MSASLTYSVVVATRNRRDALALGLPLAIAQMRPPERIVVVDRSDDHEAVRALCASLAGRGVPIDVLYGDQPNSARQRNQGLDLVDSDVVMLPDDDAFWFPDTAERVMAVYEADPGELIGGVSAIETADSPLDEGAGGVARAASRKDAPRLAMLRNRLEYRLVPQPFDLYGARRIAELGPAARAAGISAPFITTIGGFRMSFRTPLLRRLRFDDTLGSRVGYSQHEDKDLGLRVLAAGALLAAAPGARVEHHVYPGKRAGGFAYGFFQVFNYLYSCRKSLADGDPALGALRRHLSYKVALYALRRRDDYEREVYRGARAALAELPEVMAAPRAELVELYGRLSGRNLVTSGHPAAGAAAAAVR